jgi:hypothetical protein
MKTTELRHWKNGYQLRGGWFHTLNISILKRMGIMFSWGTLPNGYRKDKLKMTIFILI